VYPYKNSDSEGFERSLMNVGTPVQINAETYFNSNNKAA
jgi:hypothetical protein